ERRGGGEIRQRGFGRSDAIVVRRPPDLIRPGIDGRRGQGQAVGGGAALPGGAAPGLRDLAEGGVVHVDPQARLGEVVGAPGAGGGGANLLHRGQQQADEHSDDGDDNQQFDEREPAAIHDFPRGRYFRTGITTLV